MICGDLAGEGVHGLQYIADTTYSPCWWCEIALGGLVLVAVAALRRTRAMVALETLVVAVLTAAVFVVVYRQDLTIVVH